MKNKSDWITNTLPNLAEFINGYAFKPKDWSKEGLPIVRIEQLKNDDADFDYYNGSLPAHNIINQGDLIFAWSASLFLKIWKNGKAALNQHLFKVVPYDHTDKNFLKYLIEYNLVKLSLSAHGSTMKHITRKDLNIFEVRHPKDKTEQTAIAHILSTVDKVIEQTEKLIAKYKRIKTGLMQDLLTKGIDENGNIRSEKTHKFKDSPLGRIPVEWEVKNLQTITAEIGDGIHATPSYIDSSDMFFVNGNNLKDGEIIITPDTNCVSFSEYKKHFIELNNNTILMSINGTIGNIAIYNNEKIILGKSVAYIKGKDSVQCSFLYNQLQSFILTHYFDNELTGSTIKNLSLASIRNAPIPIPEDPNEQERIIERLHLFDDFLSKNNVSLKKLSKLKSGLMQDLLTGKVRVPEELIEEINKKNIKTL